MRKVGADIIIIVLSVIVTLALIIVAAFVEMPHYLKYVLIIFGIAQCLICAIISVRLDEKQLKKEIQKLNKQKNKK